MSGGKAVVTVKKYIFKLQTVNTTRYVYFRLFNGYFSNFLKTKHIVRLNHFDCTSFTRFPLFFIFSQLVFLLFYFPCVFQGWYISIQCCYLWSKIIFNISSFFHFPPHFFIFSVPSRVGLYLFVSQNLSIFVKDLTKTLFP
jgi:hypothetical protein